MRQGVFQNTNRATANRQLKEARLAQQNSITIPEKYVSYDTKNVSADDTTSRQFTAMQNARNYFNDCLFKKVFGVSLGPVMLRPARHGAALGYYSEASWKEEAYAPVPEISLCPCGMHRSPERVFSTLIHELCHQYQHEYGNPGRGRYHNVQFAEIMQKVGLICSDTGEPGGKQTGDSMTHYIDPHGLYAAAFAAMPKEYFLPFKPLFDEDYHATGIPRRSIGKYKPGTDNSKTKFTCLGCGAAAWGKPSLDINCNQCKQKMMVINDFGKK